MNFECSFIFDTIIYHINKQKKNINQMQMLLQFDQFQVISQAVLTLFRRNGNMAICLNKYLMKKQKFPKFYRYAECQIFFFVEDVD